MVYHKALAQVRFAVREMHDKQSHTHMKEAKCCVGGDVCSTGVSLHLMNGEK